MYQTLVLGLGFLILLGSVYLIRHVDVNNVLTSAANTGGVVSINDLGTSSLSSLAGTYTCDTDSGCQDPSTLTLTDTGSLSMVTSYANGLETLQESGAWKPLKEGRLALVITASTSTYPRPKVISVKYVSPSALAGLVYDQFFYKDWLRPVFRKQDNSTDGGGQ